MDQEIPDYDMDSEDESWVNEQSKKMEIAPVKFEEMMDRLEKGSGQQVIIRLPYVEYAGTKCWGGLKNFFQYTSRQILAKRKKNEYFNYPSL